MGEIIIGFLIGLLFIGLGIAISKYKCYWLIAGYNTSSEKEKKQVDIEQVAKHMGRLMYLIAICIWGMGIFGYLGLSINIVVAVMVIIIFGYVFYIQKFDKSSDAKTSRIIIGIIAVITLVIGTIVFCSSSEPNKVTRTDSKLIIEGSYGCSIKNEDIKSIEFVDTMPKILSRNNGYSDGTNKKGSFKLDGDKKGKLYLEGKNGPFIKIVTDEYDIYINNKDEKVTRDIYKSIITPGV